MEERPKIGLITLRSLELHLPHAEDLLSRMERNLNDIVTKLADYFELAGCWVVEDENSLSDCKNSLTSTDIDLVILVYLNHGDDHFLKSLLETIGSTPLAAWCYVPWRHIPKPLPLSDLITSTGAIGMFGAFAYLRDLNIPFQFTYGSPDDPKVIDDLVNYAKAAQIVKSLRSVKIGIVTDDLIYTSTLPALDGTFRASGGIQIEQIPYQEIAEQIQMVDQETIDHYLSALDRFGCVLEIPELALFVSTRLSIALRAVAESRQLSLLAVPEPSDGIRDTIQVRPGLPPDPNEEGHIAYQTEFDLGLFLSHLILRKLSGTPAFLMQIWFWDKATNIVIGGQSGIQSLSIADPKQVCVIKSTYCEHENCMEGAQLEYIARSGRVTLLQLRLAPDGWRAIALSGFCLESDPWIDEIPHAVVRLDGTIDFFLDEIARVGSSRNWVMAYGDVFSQLHAVCEMMGIKLEVLRH